MECLLSFLSPCHFQSYKAMSDAAEKLFLSWFRYNRCACLSCVHCSREQKAKWSLWKRELWKRTRWWIVSNKSLLGIYLWWILYASFSKVWCEFSCLKWASYFGRLSCICTSLPRPLLYHTWIQLKTLNCFYECRTLLIWSSEEASDSLF